MQAVESAQQKMAQKNRLLQISPQFYPTAVLPLLVNLEHLLAVRIWVSDRYFCLHYRQNSLQRMSSKTPSFFVDININIVVIINNT
jgi:hypothetical protein